MKMVTSLAIYCLGTWILGTTTKFNIFTDKIFCRYLHYYFIGKNFTDRFMDISRPSVNLSSLISFLSVKTNTDGFTDEKCTPKKLPALIYQRNNSIGDC